MSGRDLDLIIVGGSFAGLACAAAAAARGARVAVLDQKAEPGARCHTTGIIVKEVAAAWDLPCELTRKIPGVRLYAPGGRSIDLRSPGYYFLATDTPALMRWFAARAEACGALLLYGTAFRGARRDRDGIVIDDAGIGARYLIGADGPRSRVAEVFGLGRNRRFLTGVELEFEGAEGVDVDNLHVLVDYDLAPGYIAWAVPGVEVLQVGLASNRRAPIDFKRTVDRIASIFDLSGARIVSRRGGRIPTGGPVRPFHRGNVMLIGDAAGLVSPLTAGGIHTALHHGRVAGMAVADHLLNGAALPASVMRRSMPRFRVKRILRLFADLPIPNRLIDAALSNSLFQAMAQTVFFHHRGLWSADAWRDMGRTVFNHGSGGTDEGRTAPPDRVT